MIGWRRKNSGEHDMGLGFFLKRHDAVVPPSASELYALESRIMAQIAALPNSPAGAPIPFWAASKPWILSGAAAGALFIMLGFNVGRDFGDLFSQPADSASLFASADDTPWPSFITAPSPMEEDNDAAQ